MKTLVLVDVQNDFMPGGSLAVPGGDRIVEPLNRIVDIFGLVVATQDWHPRDHVSFASNHQGKRPFDTLERDGYIQTLWPDHCVQGSDGARLHAGLNTDRVEAIFRKGTDRQVDSYSGFYDNRHLRATGLAGYLREKGARDLYIGGLAADICVYFTVKDALEAGFAATVIQDGACALDEAGYEIKKEALRLLGVHFMNSVDLV